jgi:hypothetical protein
MRPVARPFTNRKLAGEHKFAAFANVHQVTITIIDVAGNSAKVVEGVVVPNTSKPAADRATATAADPSGSLDRSAVLPSLLFSKDLNDWLYW